MNEPEEKPEPLSPAWQQWWRDNGHQISEDGTRVLFNEEQLALALERIAIERNTPLTKVAGPATL